MKQLEPIFCIFLLDEKYAMSFNLVSLQIEENLHDLNQDDFNKRENLLRIYGHQEDNIVLLTQNTQKFYKTQDLVFCLIN